MRHKDFWPQGRAFNNHPCFVVHSCRYKLPDFNRTLFFSFFHHRWTGAFFLLSPHFFLSFGFFLQRFGSKAPKCKVCGKSVYAMEMVKYDLKVYHKKCFNCKECGKHLEPKAVAKMAGTIYCKHCFEKKFRERGRCAMT